MRVHKHARRSSPGGFAALSTLVVAAAAVLIPLGSPPPAAAQPPQNPPSAVYDHSKDKGKPGTRGPLPPGASRSELSVKFRSDRDVRLRDGQPVAVNRSDTEALRKVLAKYPGTTFHRVEPEPEEAVDAERARLQARTGRQLPDLNSWFTVRVGGDIESLLEDLNALPAVELAIARLATAAPAADPLQYTQVYRTGVNPGSGIDADFAYGLPGGRGAGITVTDVESGGYDTATRTFGSIASGDAHSLMVTRDGTVRAWGLNSSGQLGDGTTTNANVFMPVTGLTEVVQVAAGGNFSMALRADGTVWTWGANTNGQLGNNSTTNSAVPVQVSGLSQVATIAAGSNFAVAVLTDGTMRAWGANNSGQLGNGNTTQQRLPVPVTGVTGVSTARGSVAAGAAHTLAVSASGALRAWGANASGQLGRNPATTPSSSTALTVTGVGGARQAAAGAAASYVRLSSGAVWSWGANASGQLGNGSTTNNFTPAAVPGLGSVEVVTAGGSSAATVHTDHVTRAWGLNSSGQLGTGNNTSVRVPTVVNMPQPGALLVAAGATHMAAVDFNADPGAHTFVWTWGANSSGQLGIGGTTPSNVPVQAVYLQNLWNTCHEDLANRPSPAGPPIRLQQTNSSPCRPSTGDMHGTHAVGFVGAQADNGLGLNGLLPEARLQLVNAGPGPSAVALARWNSAPGDVIWFEVAYATNEGWWPWELAGDIYDQVVMATAEGITVVEPAGNGGNSLDDSHPYSTWIMGRPDSGAIMVGAGEPSATMPWTHECKPTDPHPAPRTAMGFSTYGTRVDVQGWGKCISTLNSHPIYNDLTPNETDRNRMYYSNFNGTSGAAPMVVGAVGAVQGVLKQSGPPLTPAQIRALLERTGTPQPANDPKHIGPLPNIRAAIDDVRGGTTAGTAEVWDANGRIGDASTTNDRPRSQPAVASRRWP